MIFSQQFEVHPLFAQRVFREDHSSFMSRRVAAEMFPRSSQVI
jgi:hypothetical protein